MPKPSLPSLAARELAVTAPLVARWCERVLAARRPPLTLAQFLALRAVAEGGAAVGSLALRAGVSGPAASQLLGTLVSAGLVERRPNVADRRSRHLSLTRGGERTLRDAAALLEDALAGLLDGVPTPDLAALGRALPHVEAALSGAPPPRRPAPKRPPPAGGPPAPPPPRR